MGILDRLRNEATSKQESEFSSSVAEQRLEHEYQANILPKMQKTYRFLKEIVDHLNYLEKAVEVKGYSNNYRQLGTLFQTNYKINTDGYSGVGDFNRIMQVNVSFVCQGVGTFGYSLEGKSQIEHEVAFLHSKHIPFTWKRGLNKAVAAFTVTRRIPILFKFEVDFINSQINLLINNHENFNVYSKAFSPEAINDALLDEVVRFMLREDSDFIRLEITSQDRQRIQKKVADEQRLREQLLAEIKKQEMKIRDAHNEHLFFRQIKLLTGKKQK
ncbi:MAG: hypothetical protein PHR16_16535 [Methylovulum sp.]|nr:hypothetical protein [Methylovulum sp.]